MGNAISLFILATNTYTDCKRREILVRLTFLTAAAGWMYRLAFSHHYCFSCLMSILLTMVPGAFLMLLSVWTHGKLGMGDGLVVLAVGVWTGFRRSVFMTLIALLLAAVCAAVLWMKRSGKREIPFLPFLLAGFLLSWFC